MRNTTTNYIKSGTRGTLGNISSSNQNEDLPMNRVEYIIEADYIEKVHSIIENPESHWNYHDNTGFVPQIVNVSFGNVSNYSDIFNIETSHSEENRGLNWGVLSLTSLIIATAIGNILVCLAVCWEKRLQNMTNYFLMSLAIADLLVSLLVMPLGMVVELYGKFTFRGGSRGGPGARPPRPPKMLNILNFRSY